MKALSVRQPWASRIAEGAKTIELRSWSTDHRGPLLICSALQPYSEDSLRRLGDGPRGVALCVVDLVDVRPATDADRDASMVSTREAPTLEGLYAWVFEGARPASGAKQAGKPGLFTVPD